MEDKRKLANLDLGATGWRALEAPEFYDGVPLRRMVGYLIDVVLIALATLALGFVFFILGVLTFGLATPFGVVALALLPVAYHTSFIGRHGATPGMALLGLKVRTWTGARPDFLQALLMTVLFYATVLPTGYLILVIALFNDQRRTLHDLLSGVLVIRAAGRSGSA
ncbi:MAG: RDD family protein [Kiloniellales bacterium]